MRRLSLGIGLLISLLTIGSLLAACGSDGPSRSVSSGGATASSGLAARQEAPAAAQPLPAPQIAGAPAFDEGDKAQAQASVAAAQSQAVPPLDTANGDAFNVAAAAVDRRVISTGDLTLRVDDPVAAAGATRSIAEGVGGFVDNLSIQGGADERTAYIIVRVPQAEFFNVLARVAALGESLGQTIGSQDVTEEFVDLEARLNSLKTEEARLLQLLNRAESVADILTIESELARVRSDTERIQGRLNYLQDRVALATLSVSFYGPQTVFTQPPSGSVTLEVRRVRTEIDALKALVARFSGVVDSTYLDISQDSEYGTVSARVPRSAFLDAVAAVLDRGRVTRQTISEGGAPPPGVTEVEPTEPDASLSIELYPREPGANVGLIAAIAAPSGTLGLIILVGGAVWLIRRRRTPPVPSGE